MSETSTAAMETFVINLDRDAERLATFYERNHHLQAVTKFPAVDGTTLARADLIRDGVITPTCEYKDGSLGCALSHIALWKRAIERNTPITILEDDIVCAGNFLEESRKLRSALAEDWDIALLGYLFYPLFVWLDLGTMRVKLSSYSRRYDGGAAEFRNANVESNPIRASHVFGLQAYSISPSGAKKLLEKCLPLDKRNFAFPGTSVVIEDTGLDCPMSAAYPDLKAFVSLPPLAIHDDALASTRLKSGG